MKKFNMLLIAAILFTAFSCEKRQNNKTAEKLDGGWEISRIMKADGEVDENSMPQGVTLSSCKVSDGPCDGLWISNNGDTGDFEWTVTEKGTIFTITPVVSSAPANQATSDLADYKGDYKINEVDNVQFIVQKGETILEFLK